MKVGTPLPVSDRELAGFPILYAVNSLHIIPDPYYIHVLCLQFAQHFYHEQHWLLLVALLVPIVRTMGFVPPAHCGTTFIDWSILLQH